MFIVVSAGRARSFDEAGAPLSDEPFADLVALVRAHEVPPTGGARWVWDDTRRWYPQLLAAGLPVERCVDLRLSHAILRHSSLTADSALALAPDGPWDAPPDLPQEHQPKSEALFDLVENEPTPEADPVEEWLRQRQAIESAADPARIGLLLAAESAGALIACEMKHKGLPFDPAVHEQLLEQTLGPRPRHGERPVKLEALKQRLVEVLGFDFNPDSQADLLKALKKAGLRVESTSKWELQRIEHPVVEPLLEYKKLSRLMTANGWNWLDAWVADGRFRPEYVPGGVVTGRWAASGGGALQLPKQIRGAVIADPGWKLVVADAAQLEPRILTAMSGDRGMAKAGEGDLYEGIVASGAVDTRAKAKIAMLGAMYGATTGDSGRLMPALAKAFPRAIALVDEAARAGERGDVVTTRLGRSSPRPGGNWREVQAAASGDGATEADTRRARSQSRSWGRFTRNFVVQGSAAEWALCWMANLRLALWNQPSHLVFFLHDEVIVHAPAELAEEAAEAIRASAAAAGRLLFGELPVTFPVTTAIVDNYGQAK